ncbi:hypothetical protein [Lysobacter capsici]|uniref:hypothetical protein n=1 Tax=Lysobacter capsici TaxID=435897 RepID=UPI001C004B39|nr:hypothetical protein [Lysobacter capsici]QWF19730.1 hypothetical protein KME82_08770 [Lysobacter capsici]
MSGAAAHAIAIALAADDLDRAITLGLLQGEHAPVCAHCAPQCRQAMREAREQRLRALAARERYRARDARLQRRADERAAQRAAAPAAVASVGIAAADDLISVANDATPPRPALPSAAAAALARAKAKAAQRGPT